MKSFFTLLFAFLLFTACEERLRAQVPANVNDSLALVDFYNTMNGKSWANNSGWLAGPVNTWFGVTVDGSSGRVLTLSLDSNRVEGQLPASIVKLTALTYLILSNNRISGSLPEDIGQMTGLEYMTFWANQLSGELPPSIVNLTGLGYMDFTYNQLSGELPANIGNMISLSWINLYGNHLKGEIPASIGNLTKLYWIDLTANQLSGSIPKTVGNLFNMNMFRIWGNKLTGEIPHEVGQMVNLETLDLSLNQLSGEIPAEIGSLTKLKNLYLGVNKLSGKIPQSLNNLSILENFHCESNKFTFDGMEEVVKSFPFTLYYPQDTILHIRGTQSGLSVSAGGYIANNTYKWYKDGQLEATIVADSTFKPTKYGKYNVEITNALAPLLTLKSDTISPFFAFDPNPSMIDDDGGIVNDLANLDMTKTVVGAATDGVTKLLLVDDSKDPIIFSILGNGNGTLSSLSDQGSQYNSLTISPNENGKIIAIYTVPDGYGEKNDLVAGRLITITTRNTRDASDTGSLKITLVTPPVVLIHGMWSSPQVWSEGGFDKALEKAGFGNIALADYSTNSSNTFDPQSQESSYGRNALLKSMEEGLATYRQKEIAATQVDVVGHSLGGLIARSLSQQYYYTNPENFHKGYFHKLITLGTPHRGSPFGPRLWNIRNNWVFIPEIDLPVKVSFFMSFIGKPIGTVHRDFDILSSGINNLQKTPSFKSYAVAGSQIRSAVLNIFCLPIFGITQDSIFASKCHTSSTPLPNDLIVPLSSQQGYISNTQTFLETSHLELVKGNLSETNSGAIQNKVVQLLLSDDATEFGTGFPAPSSKPLDCNTVDHVETTNISNKFVKTNQPIVLNQPAVDSTNSIHKAVHIISILKDATFSNDNPNVSLKFTTSNGTLATHSIFMIEDIGWFTADNSSDNTVNFTLPANASFGRKNVVLLVRDTTGMLLGDTSHIIIVAADILDSISADPGIIHLDSALRERSLYVHGYFKSSGITHTDNNITDESAGTMYAAKKGGIFTVGKNGLLVAKKAGADTLLISNSGITIKVAVIVDSNFSQTMLYSNAIDFPTISDKVIGAAPFGLSASASSGEDVSFSLISGNATLENGVLQINGPGKITVKASQNGNVYFAPAAEVSQTFCVSLKKPATISGDTLSCDIQKAYTISKSPGVNYNWSLSGDGMMSANDTSATIIWNQAGQDTIKVSSVTLDGCYSEPSVLIVSVKNIPPPVISVNGSVDICEGDSVLLRSDGQSGIQWYDNGNLLNGATTPVYNAKQSGNYTLKFTDSVGCSSSSEPVHIAVNPVPPKPVISLSNNMLFSSASSGNQWFLNDTLIAGATTGSYLLQSPGKYTVQETSNHCTGPMSDPYEFTGSNIMIYPNPVNNRLSVVCHGMNGISIKIYDALGRQLYVADHVSGTHEIDTRQWAKNLYVVVVFDETGKQVLRKVIIKV